MKHDLLPGTSFPLGATVYPHGVNFCVFSHHGESVELLLFDDRESSRPSRTVRLDPVLNRTANYWHVFLPGVHSGQLYAYRVHGPFAPAKGLRFDGKKVLLDPYGREVAAGKHYDRNAAVVPGDNCACAMKSVVVDSTTYDWQGDLPLNRPYSETIIYELHVGGFTSNPNSGVAPAHRGTYGGIVEKIPYLADLGITAVELLPVQQFDDQDAPKGLANYWGYSPLAFFAPHSGYSSRRQPLGPSTEFRDMVKALHKAGIEVILDVVFNHTAEGNENGPTFSFRGLEDRAYYTLDEKGNYRNFTGCGNTVNANYSIVRRLIMDCLRYWVSEMHVDGFRFDLASVLSRDETGVPLVSPPVLWEIDSDPVLAGTKIIAEAWDAGGLYQVGSFVGDRFREWNGRFRDDIRRFVKGEDGMMPSVVSRILGSPDLYPASARRSINFITCHDGFTMNDLVSYTTKHNSANLQNDTDGSDHNFSWNCGVEGPTGRKDVAALRSRQIRNFATILLLSHGTPMLLMGDEVRRTQGGNNNAYCQNNPAGWFDWDDLRRNKDVFRFVKSAIAFVKSYALFRHEGYLDSSGHGDGPGIVWHGVRLGQPDRGSASHAIAFTLQYHDKSEYVHVMLNAYWDSLAFELPPPPGGRKWRRIIDTALVSPQDILDAGAAPVLKAGSYIVQARSCVVVAAEGGRKKL
jgi:isoamylase